MHLTNNVKALNGTVLVLLTGTKKNIKRRTKPTILVTTSQFNRLSPETSQIPFLNFIKISSQLFPKPQNKMMQMWSFQNLTFWRRQRKQYTIMLLSDDNLWRHLFMVALCNRADHTYFHPVVCSSFFFFSSPNLSGRRLDVCHTSTHGVALVRI